MIFNHFCPIMQRALLVAAGVHHGMGLMPDRPRHTAAGFDHLGSSFSFPGAGRDPSTLWPGPNACNAAGQPAAAGHCGARPHAAESCIPAAAAAARRSGWVHATSARPPAGRRLCQGCSRSVCWAACCGGGAPSAAAATAATGGEGPPERRRHAARQSTCRRPRPRIPARPCGIAAAGRWRCAIAAAAVC